MKAVVQALAAAAAVGEKACMPAVEDIREHNTSAM